MPVSAPHQRPSTQTRSSLDGGKLELDGSTTYNANRGIYIDAAGGSIQGYNGVNATIAGVISGVGGLALGPNSNPGLTLAAANTYLGGTDIGAGQVFVSTNANLGDPSGALNFGGGTTLSIANTATTGFVSGRTITLYGRPLDQHNRCRRTDGVDLRALRAEGIWRHRDLSRRIQQLRRLERDRRRRRRRNQRQLARNQRRDPPQLRHAPVPRQHAALAQPSHDCLRLPRRQHPQQQRQRHPQQRDHRLRELHRDWARRRRPHEHGRQQLRRAHRVGPSPSTAAANSKA